MDHRDDRKLAEILTRLVALEEQAQATASLALVAKVQVLSRMLAGMAAVAPEEVRVEAKKVAQGIQLWTVGKASPLGPVFLQAATEALEDLAEAEVDLARRRSTPVASSDPAKVVRLRPSKGDEG